MNQSSFDGYYFECPPVNKNNVETKSFEFVLRKTYRLDDKQANPRPFMDYFTDRTDTLAVSFPNLGNDAMLVIPNRMPDARPEDDAQYAHLAKFMRSDLNDEIDALWKETARLVLKKIENNGTGNRRTRNLWISTSGNAVPWLHIRLSKKPKYYTFLEYKKIN